MREIVREPLRAAAIAAFVVGVLLFFLNPPSLSGAGGLITLIAGAGALVLLSAWATVALGGHGPGDDEFERVIERSEALARMPAPEAPPDWFDELVGEAIDELPSEFRELLRRVPVVVSTLGREYHAYGMYYGDTVARDNYPDRIVIYRDTLVRDFGHDTELLRAQVTRTVRHELAHHLGWGESGVRGLGL